MKREGREVRKQYLLMLPLPHMYIYTTTINPAFPKKKKHLNMIFFCIV